MKPLLNSGKRAKSEREGDTSSRASNHNYPLSVKWRIALTSGLEDKEKEMS